MAEMTEILKVAVEKGASDIHISIGLPPMARISGRMTPLPYDVLTADEARRLVYSLMFDAQRRRFEEDLELDVSSSIQGVGRFRLNALLHRNGVGAVLRVIPSKIPTPQDINLPAAALEVTKLPRGLVLITGPTGSGKSTTLACIMDLINQQRREHILTVEDPIEFVYESKSCVVTQREVGAQTKGFGEALKHALRQDPDVVLIGEMRDLETISAALTIAETGHLVFGTLHTNDAPSTIDRIVDVFPPFQQQQVRTQLAGSLQAVISQILLPRADGKGRVAAREIMIMTSAIANLIREGKTHMIYNAIESGSRQGMISMDRTLAGLVQSGLISIDVALEKAHNPDTIKQYKNQPTTQAPTQSPSSPSPASGAPRPAAADAAL